MADMGIAIEGLGAFRRALRQTADDLPKELRLALKAAAERVVPRARERYSRQFRTRSGRTQASIRARATQTSAAVAMGGARFPWAAGQEFGSNKYRQFFPYTGKGPSGRGSVGRAIFPAVREEAKPALEDIQQRFDALARRAFPEA